VLGMIHFFMRHGVITPENKEYAELEMLLHRPLPVLVLPEQEFGTSADYAHKIVGMKPGVKPAVGSD